jgi:hypothetical protein
VIVTETFRVREINGTREYTIVGARNDTASSTLDRRTLYPTPIQYRLADNSSGVRQIDADTFEILATGQRVHRIS